VYNENVNRKKAEEEINRFVAHEQRHEGGSGLYSPIRWLESGGVLPNYNEAVDYIKSHDKGWYDALAVRYRDFDGKETAALTKAKEKFKIAADKYHALDGKFHFADIKAAFIGCHTCGSKISREHLKTNYCPVCRNDLRPTSTRETIARYRLKMDKAAELVAKEDKKCLAKSSKVKWLVKIEWHT
jgi:hypothetical protein